jgi:hypothetical protein
MMNQLSTNRIALFFIAFLSLTLAASCEKTSNGQGEKPNSLIIKEIRLLRVDELNTQNEEWDPEGAFPDVFVTIKIDEENTVILSDTLVDYVSGEIGVFELKQEITLNRDVTSIAIILYDDDYDPSIPVSLQSDDFVVKFDSKPWGLPLPLWERDVKTLTKPDGTIELVIQREF